jgi:hypothetical protein
MNIKIQKTERQAKCRLCEKKINKNTEAVVMKQVHVSPKRVDLWFHTNCIKTALSLIS